MAECVNNLC